MHIKDYKIIHFLLHTFIISAAQDILDENAYKFYPCSDSDKVIEIFKKSNPPRYNLTVILPNFLDTPDIIKLYVKYDSLTNTTLHFKFHTYYDDSRSIKANALVEKNSNLTITIAPLYGKKLPNVISVKLNSNEICNGFIYKDIWDNYTDTSEETTTIKITNSTRSHQLKKINTCGKTFISDEGYIVKGIDSTPGKWPWHTALYRLHGGGELKYICGGSLISKTTILTAGHCVIESGVVLLAKRLLAVLGKYNLIGNNVNLQEKKVYEIILHGDFTTTTLQNDLAILKLSSEVLFNDYVQPICLVSKELYYEKIVKSAGTYGYTVGWGGTQYQNFSDNLIESQLPVVEKLTCMKSHPVFLNKLLIEGSFCAGYRNGTNVCNGDSGGGLYFKSNINDEEGTWYLGGIISLGIPERNSNKCDPTHYSLFTDVFYYKEFINEYL